MTYHELLRFIKYYSKYLLYFFLLQYSKIFEDHVIGAIISFLTVIFRKKIVLTGFLFEICIRYEFIMVYSSNAIIDILFYY